METASYHIYEICLESLSSVLSKFRTDHIHGFKANTVGDVRRAVSANPLNIFSSLSQCISSIGSVALMHTYKPNDGISHLRHSDVAVYRP